MSILSDFLIKALIGALLGGFVTFIIGLDQQKRFIRRLKQTMMERDMSQVSLDDELLMTRLLGHMIKKAKYKADIIFAVSPGGLMIAEWLARRELGSYRNPLPVRSICIKTIRSMAGLESEKAYVMSNIRGLTSGLSKQAKVLLVNDISRGGETLKVAIDFLKKFFPENNIVAATLICNRNVSTKPRFRVIETVKDVDFDWKRRSSK